MVQKNGERRPRSAKVDPLQLALDRFARTLAEPAPGKEGDWATELAATLDGLANGLQQHITNAEAPDGLLTEVDLTRPTLARKVGVLRKEHADFLNQISAFQLEVRRVAQAFHSRAQPPDLTSILPEPAAPTGVADLSEIRHHGEQLVADLQHHFQVETDVTLESVATDIGVGD
jgi:hypothetical protein